MALDESRAHVKDAATNVHVRVEVSAKLWSSIGYHSSMKKMLRSSSSNIICL